MKVCFFFVLGCVFPQGEVFFFRFIFLFSLEFLWDEVFFEKQKAALRYAGLTALISHP